MTRSFRFYKLLTLNYISLSSGFKLLARVDCVVKRNKELICFYTGCQKVSHPNSTPWDEMNSFPHFQRFISLVKLFFAFYSEWKMHFSGCYTMISLHQYTWSQTLQYASVLHGLSIKNPRREFHTNDSFNTWHCCLPLLCLHSFQLANFLTSWYQFGHWLPPSLYPA